MAPGVIIHSQAETRPKGLWSIIFESSGHLRFHPTTGGQSVEPTTQTGARQSARAQVDRLYTGAFPYSFDFLYWEEALNHRPPSTLQPPPRRDRDEPRSASRRPGEVGIIDEELMKNLAICGAVILVVILAEAC